MALKIKQYLENSWYRWASQDRQTGYAAQFQYWENVNVRDMKNWVCLSWGKTKVFAQSECFYFFTHWGAIYTVNRSWEIYDRVGNLQLTITEMGAEPYPIWISFWWKIYIATYTCLFEVTPWTPWTYVDISPTSAPFFTLCNCALNYANTFLLIWAWSKLWRLDKAWNFDVIREFDSSYKIYWLTQEWNYLKIYVSNWSDTKIHYAKWTFDVEETWLIQTVTFNAMYLWRWSVASDQNNDYALFETSKWEFKLAKISWYNKTDIRWTQEWWWKKVFSGLGSVSNIMARDWVLFASMNEWIWTFTEYNGWLWWWCVEFVSNVIAESMLRHNDKLYVCEYDKDTETYIMYYYDLSFHPKTYQDHWFIIGRAFDWGCWSLFKKNTQATVTYNMPVWTSMELSYRYDRSSFGYDKSNFLSIKELTDTNECYDIIFPTTPWKQDENLLALENWTDNILLENWNKILLEDLLVCPFNKTWNYLEYRVDLNWYLDEDSNTITKTPILFEHSLLYEDRIRKYR